MLSRDEVLAIFKETNALLSGHFELSSGLHSAQYLQCALILQYPEHTSILCGELAGRFKNESVDVVIGPALGGIVLSYETARALNARALFGEREKGEPMALRRGFRVEPGERVLIVEDVITTGGSVKELAALCDERGAAIVGIGAVVDRSDGDVDFSGRVESLLKIEVETFEPAVCPLCKEGRPLVKPGSKVRIK